MKLEELKYPLFRKIMKYVLIIDSLAFLTLLTSSSVAERNVKIITALLVLGISGAALALLYFSRELLKKRSFWMTVSAGAIALCAVCSLILRYPSPNPLDQANPYTTVERTESTEFSIEGWITEPEESSETPSSESNYDISSND